MNSSRERAEALARIDALEDGLTALLNALESKNAPADSVERAIAALELLPFDPQATIEAFADAPALEVALAKRRLEHVASLDAIVRAECERMLATTTLAIERTRVLKASLDTLESSTETGDSVDCVR
jgi:hypothetical protein